MLLPTLAALLLSASPLRADPPTPPPTSPDPTARIQTLISNLKSNTPDPAPREAIHQLCGLTPLCIKPLYAALSSPDERQRQLAAETLRRIDNIGRDGDEPPTPPLPPNTPPIKIDPTELLLRVCIEGLKNDNLPGPLSTEREYGEKPIVFNAASGTRFLIKHAATAEPLLAEALKSPDLQQRFCAAVALGFGARTRHAEAICKILIPHLRDNSIPSDALWAACALYHLGPAADVHLQAAATTPVDKQQRELLNLILLDIRVPLKSPDDYGPRTTGKLTTLELDGAFDPLIGFNQYTLAMDWPGPMTEKNRDTPRPKTPAPTPPANVFLNPKKAE